MSLTKFLTTAAVIGAPIALGACQGDSRSSVPESSAPSVTTMDPSAAGTTDPGLPPSAQPGATVEGAEM